MSDIIDLIYELGEKLDNIGEYITYNNDINPGTIKENFENTSILFERLKDIINEL